MSFLIFLLPFPVAPAALLRRQRAVFFFSRSQTSTRSPQMMIYIEKLMCSLIALSFSSSRLLLLRCCCSFCSPGGGCLRPRLALRLPRIPSPFYPFWCPLFPPPSSFFVCSVGPRTPKKEQKGGKKPKADGPRANSDKDRSTSFSVCCRPAPALLLRLLPSHPPRPPSHCGH